MPDVGGNCQRTDAESCVEEGARRPSGTPRDGGEPGEDIYLLCKSI